MIKWLTVEGDSSGLSYSSKLCRRMKMRASVTDKWTLSQRVFDVGLMLSHQGGDNLKQPTHPPKSCLWNKRNYNYRYKLNSEWNMRLSRRASTFISFHFTCVFMCMHLCSPVCMYRCLCPLSCSASTRITFSTIWPLQSASSFGNEI